MATKRDRSDDVLLDDSDDAAKTQASDTTAASSGAANAMQSRITQPQKPGGPIEGLDSSEDPTGGAGGP